MYRSHSHCLSACLPVCMHAYDIYEQVHTFVNASTVLGQMFEGMPSRTSIPYVAYAR